jgi:hypothetical protein
MLWHHKIGGGLGVHDDLDLSRMPRRVYRSRLLLSLYGNNDLVLIRRSGYVCGQGVPI